MAGPTALVKSPGVPGEVPQVAAARAAGVPVWSEVELAARMLPDKPDRRCHGHERQDDDHPPARRDAHARAAASARWPATSAGRCPSCAGRCRPQTWIACELSSFQLEDIDRLRCRVAVILNVTPDHLDRHGSIAEYTRCKLRILENQGEGDTAVLNGDDEVLRRRGLPGAGARVGSRRRARPRSTGSDARLRGEHNLENALAAAAAAACGGRRRDGDRRGAARLQPPPHRLEPVAAAGGVELRERLEGHQPRRHHQGPDRLRRGVHLILGGSLKGGVVRRRWPRAVAAGPVGAPT